ncbi:MAG: M48 family metallopeptidase [Oscillospiraceae bacterium]|nr:M48 family metallopeptidase [Oscillospiraceae bacterium]
MGLTVQYSIIRSNRKTISIQIQPDGKVIVRAPKRMRIEEIKRFVESKAGWIEKHLSNLTAQEQQKLTDQELRALREKARTLVTERVQFYAPLIGVTYTQIAIRAQHTRWGSCSSKGNLNFNCLLALVPPEVLDYVVVHELCHRKELNHSDRFWNEVGKILPDYKDRKKWLKDNGSNLIARI